MDDSIRIRVLKKFAAMSSVLPSDLRDEDFLEGLSILLGLMPPDEIAKMTAELLSAAPQSTAIFELIEGHLALRRIQAELRGEMPAG